MNRINNTALENATAGGHGNIYDNNDLFYYYGAIHDRHDRFPAVNVSGSIAAAARMAVDTYNAVVTRSWRGS
jgi:hypothetical protein